MGDIVTCAAQSSFATDAILGSSLNGLAQLALSVLTGMRDARILRLTDCFDCTQCSAPGGNDERMSNMPTIHYETLSGTFAPRRRAVNAAA